MKSLMLKTIAYTVGTPLRLCGSAAAHTAEGGVVLFEIVQHGAHMVRDAGMAVSSSCLERSRKVQSKQRDDMCGGELERHRATVAELQKSLEQEIDIHERRLRVMQDSRNPAEPAMAVPETETDAVMDAPVSDAKPSKPAATPVVPDAVAH